MQTSYSYLAPEAVVGLMTEDFTRYVDSVVPGTAVKVGKLLVADTTVGKARNAARLPAASADITGVIAMGITPFDQSREGGVDYPANRPTPVLRRGRIWVLAEGAVTRFTQPFIRFASGAGGTELGSFRGDADTATAVAAPYALYLTDAAAGGLVLVEITLI